MLEQQGTTTASKKLTAINTEKVGSRYMFKVRSGATAPLVLRAGGVAGRKTQKLLSENDSSAAMRKQSELEGAATHPNVARKFTS